MMLNSRPVRLLATLKNSAMAYPDLQLYIASDATYHDIGQFLDIDFNNCTAPSDGYFRARQRIGRIGLWWKTDVAFEWGQYEASWMRGCSRLGVHIRGWQSVTISSWIFATNLTVGSLELI